MITDEFCILCSEFMSNPQTWYIVKQEDGNCAIISTTEKEILENEQYWGPFASPEEALARRVGLIRAGKCKPV